MKRNKKTYHYLDENEGNHENRDESFTSSEEENGEAKTSPSPSREMKVVDKEDVAQWINLRIRKDGNVTFNQLLVDLQFKTGHRFSNMEMAFVKRQNVSSQLTHWCRQSIKIARRKIHEKMTVGQDFYTWVNLVLERLERDMSLEDLARVAQTSEGKVEPYDWLSGSHVNAILEHNELFEGLAEIVQKPETVLRSLKLKLIDILDDSCFRQEESTLKGSQMIEELVSVLTAVNQHLNRSFFLSSYVTEGDVRTIVENLLKQFKKPSPGEKIEVVRLNELMAALEPQDWTPQLRYKTELVLKKLLSPVGFQSETVDEASRKIFKLTAVSLVWSDIERQMLDAIHINKCREIHLTAWAAVHLNCNLDKSNWHGVNIVIATDKLYIHGESLCWDVSGLDAKNHDSGPKARSGQLPGEDGKHGEHGLPGESGGNILIQCNQLINGERWIIISKGGRGGCGQDGGDGNDGRDGRDAPKKMSIDEFTEKFPSTAVGHIPLYKQRHTKIKATLEEIAPIETRLVNISDLKGSRYVDGPTKDGGRITLVIENPVRGLVRRHIILLLKGANGERGQRGGKGGKGGQGGDGGYHGHVKIQSKDDGEMFNTLCQGLTVSSHFRGQIQTTDQSPSGTRGHDGNGGKDGRHGKAAGDVAFIDSFSGWGNWNYQPRYYGFDTDEVLEIRYAPTAPPGDAYVRCDIYSKVNRYAWIEVVGSRIDDITQRRTHEKTDVGRKRKERREAVRQKAIQRSTVQRYVDDISERLQSVAGIKEVVTGRNRSHQFTKGRIAAHINSIESTYFPTNQCIQFKVGVVKPSGSVGVKRRRSSSIVHSGIKRTSSFDISTSVTEMDHVSYDDRTVCPDCKPVDLNESEIQALRNELERAVSPTDPQVIARCLKRCETVADCDSIFHSLYGQLEVDDQASNLGRLQCHNVKEHRQQLASYVLERKAVIHSALKSFVLSVGESVENVDHPEYSARSIFEAYLELRKASESSQHELWSEIDTELHQPENQELKDMLDRKIGMTIQDRDSYPTERVFCMTQMLNQSSVFNETYSIKPIEEMETNRIFAGSSSKMKSLVDKLLEKQLNDFWQTRMKNNEQLVQEYATWIRLPTSRLGQPELELIAQANQIEILLYEQVECDNPDAPTSCTEPGSLLFKLVKIINGKRSSNNEKSNENVHYLVNKLYQDGCWDRLEIDERLMEFEEQKIHLKTAFSKSIQSSRTRTRDENFEEVAKSGFEILMDFLSSSSGKASLEHTNSTRIRYVKMLDPRFGLPDLLAKLIWQQLASSRNPDTVPGQQSQSESEDSLVFFIQQAVDWMAKDRDLDLLFIILAQTCPHRWKSELFIVELEDRLRSILTAQERQIFRRGLNKSGKRLLNLLWRNLMMTQPVGLTTIGINNRDGHSNRRLIPDKNKWVQIIEPLSAGIQLNDEDLKLLSQLWIVNWIYELKTKLWWKNVIDKLGHLLVREEERQEAVYIFLELENKKGDEMCGKLLNQLAKLNNSQQPLRVLQHCLSSDEWLLDDDNSLPANGHQLRSLEKIIEIIQADNNTSDDIHQSINAIKRLVEVSLPEQSLTLSIEEDIKDWARQNNVTDMIRQFLFVFDRAVEMKMKFRLRDTQRVALMTLLHRTETDRSRNLLIQVSTGEGKSLIVAGLAIARALMTKQKVDIITSNSVLAVRDSQSTTDMGGLRDLYELFGISVANNCSLLEEDRIRSYNAAVVYGQLSAFQRDYLLDSFYKKNIRGDRGFDCVIVDEVDCMLLDRGNNVLYLSHDIPGMESLESLYVFIWAKVKTSLVPINVDDIKSEILYDLYGIVTRDDLKLVIGEVKIHQRMMSPTRLIDFPGKLTDKLWTYLVDDVKVIDATGKLLVRNQQKIVLELFNQGLAANEFNGFDPHTWMQLASRLVFFFRNVVGRTRNIKIPSHLLPFVDRHLDTWLENAICALQRQPDVHYVVDQDRSGTCPDLNPKITIIDADTGTDQKSSQWDGGLHQFLQLKEGCQLTLQSLKAVFISNVSYIKKYDSLTGLTGTLGSQPERNFLKEMYGSSFMTVPTAYPKRFNYRSAKILTNEEDWLAALAHEAIWTTVTTQRSMLLFCPSIRDVKLVHDHLYDQLKDKSVQLHCYTRDYEKFGFESDATQLDVGHIIVATNLAGRGTDIKLSPQLIENGGLHVCLAYLPENVRIEEQAIGRAGRKGDPGSCSLILYHPAVGNGKTIGNFGAPKQEEWGSGKVFELKEIRNRDELRRISSLEEEFLSKIQREEDCFKSLTSHYEKLYGQCGFLSCDAVERNVFLLSALDQWALWLDSASPATENMKIRLNTECLNVISLEKLIPCPEWVTPPRRIQLAKHWANTSSIENSRQKLDQAAGLLDQFIQGEDSDFYPAAHYYKAYVLLRPMGRGGIQTVEKEIIKALRSAERIINQQIQDQNKYSAVISVMTKSDGVTFYPIEAYKKQKENVIHILETYLDSISSILGRRCSTQGMEQSGINADRADSIYQKLLDAKLIQNFRIDQSLIEDENDTTLQSLADEYAIDKLAVVSFLRNLPDASSQGLSENEMNCKMKEARLFTLTRKAFWELMVDHGIIINVHHCLIVTQSVLDVMDLPMEKKTKLKDEAILRRTDNPILVYNPTFTSMNQLHEENRLLMKKKDVKDILGQQLYLRNKSSFESNRAAFRIDKDKLEQGDVSLFRNCRLKESDLERIGIPECDRQDLWNALVDQRIIDQNGLPLDLKTNFHFIQCPIYDRQIEILVNRTFVAERIRRSWLDIPADGRQSRHFFAIGELPLKPERELLCDLLSIRVIKAPNVVERLNLNRDGGVMDTVSHLGRAELVKLFPDEDECNRIRTYLRSCQSSYVSLKTPDATLKSLNDVVRPLSSTIESLKWTAPDEEIMISLSSELDTFSLISFDHVIYVCEEKWSASMLIRSTAIILTGVVQVVIGVFICFKTFGLMSYFGYGLINEGMSDILYGASALIAGQNITWANYSQHKAVSVAITAASIGVASAVFKNLRHVEKATQFVGAKFAQIKAVPRTAHNLTNVQLVNQVVHHSISTIGQGMFYGMTSIGIQTIVHKHLHLACRIVGKKLLKGIDDKILQKTIVLKEILSRLYLQAGASEAERLIKRAVISVITSRASYWNRLAHQWVNGAVSAVCRGINIALNKTTVKSGGSAVLTSELVHVLLEVSKGIKMANDLRKKASENISAFVEQLEQQCQTNTTNHNSRLRQQHSESDLERFQKNAIEELKRAIVFQAGKTIEVWFSHVIEGYTHKAIGHVTRFSKQLYREMKEQSPFDGLFNHHRSSETDEQGGDTDDLDFEADDVEVGEVSTTNYVDYYLKLMKKTHNPALLVEIVRSGVPADPYCAEVLSRVLPTVLKSQGIDIAINIRIESSDGLDTYQTGYPEDPCDAIVLILRLNRSASSGQLGRYFSGVDYAGRSKLSVYDGSSTRYDCMFQCLATQLQQRYPHIDQDLLDPSILRQMTEEMITNDPSVHQNSGWRWSGWRSFTLEQGFFHAGTKVRNRRDSFSSVAEHQPASSHWKLAKDEAAILAEHHPVLSIPKMWRQQVDGVTEAPSSFAYLQNKYMKEGNYMEAIWSAIDFHVIEQLKKRTTNPYEKEKWFNTIYNHMRFCSKMEFVDQSGERKSIISYNEFNTLVQRLKVSLA